MKKLYRSATDHKLTGLCGGIGQWLGVDSTIVRLLFIISAFCSFGTTLLIYFISALFVPKAPFNDYDYKFVDHY